MKRIAAFFDLDGTLLRVNSGALWIKRERQLGRLTLRQYLEAIGYLIAYRVSVLNMESVMCKALSTVKGESENVLRRRVEEWYETDVAHLVAPGAWATLNAHRQKGHALVLLSTSSWYEGEAARKHFHLHAALTSRYEVSAGVFTGRPVLPVCYGEGKVHYAERYATDNAIDLTQSFFYTDSLSDVPMLRRVGNPRVVNPDARLRLRAIRSGWPVLDWRK